MLLKFRPFITLLLALFTSNSFAQQEYGKTILDSLCSEKYDGRGYVNKGDVRAGEFIVRELQKLGVSNFKNKPYRQPYHLNVNSFPYTIEVALDNDTLTPGKDYMVHPTSGTAQGNFEVTEINSQNLSQQYNEITNLDKQPQQQKAFIFNFTDLTDKEKIVQLKSLAYTAMDYFPVIWIEKNEQMYSVGRSHKNYPLITIDSAAYHKPNSLYLKINNAYIPDYESQNIIGWVPGKKKKKYVVFSAHYDHLGRMGTEAMFPGANDNASGVAMLLSLAKYYQQNPAKYSIVFCFFSGEEAGLEGSRYFVNHPYFKLNKVKFVLNIDIMGGASKGITLVNGTKHPKAFESFVKINQEKEYLSKIKQRGPTSNSDHHFFSQSGVPAFFIYSMGVVPNYHDIYDTPENTPLNRFNEVQNLLIDFVEGL